jgi:hypothetical protein
VTGRFVVGLEENGEEDNGEEDNGEEENGENSSVVGWSGLERRYGLRLCMSSNVGIGRSRLGGLKNRAVVILVHRVVLHIAVTSKSVCNVRKERV